MTTPEFLAHLSTDARARALHNTSRTRLEEAVRRSDEERAAVRSALNGLNNQLNSSRTELARLDIDAHMYPRTDERETHHSEVAVRLARLTQDRPHATALHQAAEVVHESATRELAWLDRPDPVGAAPAATTTAPLWHTAEIYTTARAPGYAVTTSQRVHTDGTWTSREATGAVSRARARSILQNWLDQPDSYVLADPYGRLFVACPDWRMEMIPTDLAPPPTEGDALRAALAAFGFPAYNAGEGGFTWLSVPLDRHASDDETYRGPHFRIASGGRTDRHASAHDDPWGLAEYDENGDLVTILDPAPAGSTLARDCAHAARSVAEHARSRSAERGARPTVRMSIADIARFLQDNLGQRLTARITNISDPRQVGKWASGDSVPRQEAEERLRAALQVFQLIQDAESLYTARAWLVGMNPQLEDEAPLAVIADGRFKDVMVAARAYADGG